MRARRGGCDPFLSCVCVALLIMLAVAALYPHRSSPAIKASQSLYRVTYPGGEVLARDIGTWGGSNSGVLQATLRDGSTVIIGGTWQVFPVPAPK